MEYNNTMALVDKNKENMKKNLVIVEDDENVGKNKELKLNDRLNFNINIKNEGLNRFDRKR